MIPVSSEEIEGRIGKLQTAMTAMKIDGVLILQRADLYYFSGTGQDAHLFIPVDGEPLLLVRRSYERALEDSPLKNIEQSLSLTGIQQAVNSSRKELKFLGMELDVLPVNNYRLYQDMFPKAEIVDISPIIREIRMVKSFHELDLLKEAAAMNDFLFGQVKNVLKEGMTEIEFSGRLEALYRKMGHQGLVRIRSFNNEVFYGHVMSGANLAVPSCSVGPTGGVGPNPSTPQGAGHKKIGRHEPIQIDYVGITAGYMVDQARTFFLGEPPEKFRMVHDVALRIQETLAKQGLPGTQAEALYNTALEIVQEAGLEEGFMGYPQPVPFVGHGVGLELDELPVVGRRSPHILQEGMVVALEPKFIFPSEGLAGIENTFVVTAGGLEKLTKFDDAIQVV